MSLYQSCCPINQEVSRQQYHSTNARALKSMAIAPVFDAITDEPKVILMKTAEKFNRVETENEVDKKSLLASVRGEIVKSKDNRKL